MSNHYINLLAQAERLRRHNRQGSYKTKERYFEAYKRFLRFVGETFRLQKLRNISGKHLAAYVEHMQQKGYAASTVKTDLAAIRFWQDQIPDAKYVLPDNREFELQRRQFGGVDRRWSEREFNRMLALCRESGRRNYEACIVLAYYAGLRLHEALRIDTAMARAALKTGILTIKGKGGKIREVPINETIRIEFRHFLAITPPGQKLFVPQDKPTHLVKTALQNFIAAQRAAIADADSDRTLTFHGLRHTCAARWYLQFIREGKTDHKAKQEVSRLLGHEREDVTRIYLAGVEKSLSADKDIPDMPHGI